MFTESRIHRQIKRARRKTHFAFVAEYNWGPPQSALVWSDKWPCGPFLLDFDSSDGSHMENRIAVLAGVFDAANPRSIWTQVFEIFLLPEAPPFCFYICCEVCSFLHFSDTVKSVLSAVARLQTSLWLTVNHVTNQQRTIKYLYLVFF